MPSTGTRKKKRVLPEGKTTRKKITFQLKSARNRRIPGAGYRDHDLDHTGCFRTAGDQQFSISVEKVGTVISQFFFRTVRLDGLSVSGSSVYGNCICYRKL